MQVLGLPLMIRHVFLEGFRIVTPQPPAHRTKKQWSKSVAHVFGQLRPLRLHLAETHSPGKIPTVLFLWLVKYARRLRNRYLADFDGKNS